MITQYLNRIMEIYLSNKTIKTNSNSEEHKLLCRHIPELLQGKYDEYYIKGSEGNGNRTLYPWICIMDPSITRTPQKVLYIAILFKRNMEGFYITLNQGITFFRENFKSKAYDRAQEAASYFRKDIEIDNALNEIDLNGVKADNGYGFEKTTVLGNYFEKGKFTKEEFYQTLNDYISIYKEITEQIDGDSYESIIPKIINDSELQYQDAEKAIEEINNAIFQGAKPVNHKLIEVTPKVDKVKRFKKITTPSNKKIDYVKRASENAKTGLLGEKLILAFEIDRLNKLGLEEYASKVKQVSLENDVLGYDIKSYDIDEDGNIHEIFIEVKTSSTLKDVDFYVSRNEVEQSKILEKYYWLYRVYNCNLIEKEPKFYRVKGSIEENFDLTSDTYKATIKNNAKIISSTVQINEKFIKENLIDGSHIL